MLFRSLWEVEATKASLVTIFHEERERETERQRERQREKEREREREIK